MSARHLEILVEEPSMEAFLRALLPRVLPVDRTFEIHAFQGKSDLFAKLQDRLSAYARWLPRDWRILVVVDRDDDDCRALTKRLQRIAVTSGLRTRSESSDWQLVNRLAIEELEAWYFGDWEAVCRAYPRVSAKVPLRRPYRDSDAILGGTWQAFERVLKEHGYFKTGLRKSEAARAVGAHLEPDRNRSRSFLKLRDAIVEAMA